MPFVRSTSSFFRSNMDRLRRSIRQSFRRHSPKESSDDPSKPHQWQKDEAAVRAGTCSFSVKYLGCVEVYESRGMQVCEEALKVLRNSRRRTIKGVLYVSGDGLRVVDADNKGLIVDQTIEKVSFCAPDRNHEKGFAYICRDGTTRRWMCHGFVASKDSGERLSHAVGCAFAVCLEQKQKRDREAQIIAKIQPAAAVPASNVQSSSVAQSSTTSSVADSIGVRGSFRRASLNERKVDPQNVIFSEKPPLKPTSHPNAIARPSGNKTLFERQGSLRVSSKSSTNANAATEVVDAADSFKRFNSLRLNQLPSNLARQQQSQLSGRPGSSAAGVSAIWEGEEMSTVSEISQHMSSVAISERTTNGFDSPTRSVSSGGVSHLSRWDKSFVHQTPSVAGEGPNNNESSWSPASSTFSTATSKSKGEEWLQTAANQAKLMQQFNRQTPPISNAAALGNNSFNSSPAQCLSGSGESSGSSPQHYAAYSNSVDFFPSTPAHVTAFDGAQLARHAAPSSSSVVGVAQGPLHCVAWHQSASFDVADKFDEKWAMLDNDKRRHSTSIANSNVTNPFVQESAAVNI